MHSLVLSCAFAAIVSLSAAQKLGSGTIPKGKSIQWVGHSFHWFLPQPVAQLATEAGIKGHVNVGVDRIGASQVCQHWNKDNGSGSNAVKDILKAGKTAVLTLATQGNPQEECIGKFIQLGVRLSSVTLGRRLTRI
jgi:hypothetical protein